jgi:hypothetical protein
MALEVALVTREWHKLTADTPVRSAVRFPMKLAIRIQTDEGELEATTQDVSANGVLFTGSRLPMVNSRVEFTMTMPGAVMGNPQDVVIHCVGRIVRHERRKSDDLAAAVIDEYYLRA